jgi:hypothetical protein
MNHEQSPDAKFETSSHNKGNHKIYTIYEYFVISLAFSIFQLFNSHDYLFVLCFEIKLLSTCNKLPYQVRCLVLISSE